MVAVRFMEILGKDCLIRINEICPLLVHRFLQFIQCAFMQQIIMVKQHDIITGRHSKTCIGVLGDTTVFLQLLIPDTLIVLLIFLYYVSHLCMLLIASICQTKLPISVCLILYRLDHFP